MRGWLGLLVTAAALAGAPAARAAATPVDLGAGTAPEVAVDPSGTAHVVYSTPGGTAYCRIPRGATACDVQTLLPLAEVRSTVAILRRADGLLVLVQDTRTITGAAATWVRTSADDGATWQGPTPVATGTTDHAAVALAADGQALFTLQPAVAGLLFQRAPLIGGETRALNLQPTGAASAGDGAGGELVVLADGRMVVADRTDAGTFWRVFTGGDPYDLATWPKQGLLEAEHGPQLASGPRGTFLLDARQPAEQTVDDLAPAAVRAFDSRRLRWRRPRALGADALVTGGEDPDLIQDARGRLHLAAESIHLAPTGVACVLYSRTGPTRRRRAAWFGPTTTLAALRGEANWPGHLRIGAAADGRGIAVWANRGSASVARHVYVTPLRRKRGTYRPIRRTTRRPRCPRG